MQSFRQDFERALNRFNIIALNSGFCIMLVLFGHSNQIRGRNSSVGSVLGLLSCVMQNHGFDPPLSLW